MPELPEVETIARQLFSALKSQKLTQLRIIDPKLRGISSEKLRNKALIQLRRSGKEIVFSFSEGLYLSVHLRMTGRLVWINGKVRKDSNSILVRKVANDLREKAIRAELEFSKGTLYFEDVRRFGTIKVLKSEPSNIGVDPTTPEFTIAKLTELVKGSRQQIKTWLLRQDKIVGIGNIYASEILFRSGIHPERAAGSLKPTEIKRLFASTKFILNKAIKLNGTTFSDYRDSRGDRGLFQNFLAVYDREGENCRKCNGKVICSRQGQRSTYHCKNCQR